ncbi:aspartate kinase [Taibaiella chishuiensis]|uniref:Aspartokinase n=1 Tax=Taibaiella chishuiensis TaxID=1434707 RepID=A0A2P8DCE8_9BACT|nr:aspartate kinase [Taibaiella chishuiensis]PSK94896.1 aspartate kinase [Taibaiella chishuiensis]
MQVYKFGGASIATPERMQALLPIIQYGGSPLVVVVSAYGKTTNALEAIVASALEGKREEALQKIEALEAAHNTYAASLLSPKGFEELQPRLNEYYTEMHWAIDDAGLQSNDYVYDQVVCIGEILSTSIFSAYLNEQGMTNQWIDARDIIRTNEIYRDPVVDFEFSKAQVQKTMAPALAKHNIVVTQGFIGSTADNNSTTLGREGSDYSAALFAAMLPAVSVSIWKDVEGLLNADPKLFPNTVKIEEITYHEVIEMAYYGAQVIHPKTIKPLQNANIPLYVKCFLDSGLKGTVIKNTTDTFVYPPLIVLKKDQILLQITSRDFSFITEDNLSNLYNIFYGQHVKINLIQNAAISLVVCVDNRVDKIQSLVQELEKDYKVLKNDDVQLLTVRHYTPSILEELTKGRVILLEQKTRNTVQVVVK